MTGRGSYEALSYSFQPDVLPLFLPRGREERIWLSRAQLLPLGLLLSPLPAPRPLGLRQAAGGPEAAGPGYQPEPAQT